MNEQTSKQPNERQKKQYVVLYEHMNQGDDN